MLSTGDSKLVDLSHAAKANPPGRERRRGTTRVHGPHCATPKEDVTLHTFTAEASAALAGPDWLRERRAAGYEAFASTPLPSESEEVWRYTPIDDLVLDDFAPAAGADGAGPGGRPAAGRAHAPRSGPVAGSVLVHNGRAGAFTAAGSPARARGFAFGRADDVPGSPTCSGSVQQGGDALVRLNDAFAPDPVFVDVPGGVHGRRARARRALVRRRGVRLPPHVRARRRGSAPCPSSRSSPAPRARTARWWCR